MVCGGPNLARKGVPPAPGPRSNSDFPFFARQNRSGTRALLGEAELDVYVQLSLFEWWNNPATEPLWQPNQEQFVTNISVTGPLIWLGKPAEDKLQDVSGPYYVNYNMFRVPSGGTALFEVALRLVYLDVGYAEISSDFASNDRKVLCPYVDLEILPLG